MKKSLVTIMITIAIIAIMCVNSPLVNKKSINIKTISPERKNIYDYVNLTGRVKEGNKKNIYVNDLVRVKNVFVKNGDVVKKGDALAEIVYVVNEDFVVEKSDVELEKIISLFDKYEFDIDFGKDNFEILELSKAANMIKSPINGTVTDINIKPGDTVSVIDRLMRVSDFSDLYVLLMIPEEYLTKLSEKKSVEIFADVLEGEKVEGVIEYISPVAKYIPSILDSGKTYIEAIVKMENPKNLLRPGLNVNVRISADTIKDALTLPYECIRQDNDNREYVYCVEDSELKKRFVDVGFELENEAEIKSGITEADLVVYNPEELDIEMEKTVD